jgi:hypothetical protein
MNTGASRSLSLGAIGRKLCQILVVVIGFAASKNKKYEKNTGQTTIFSCWSSRAGSITP